MTEPVRVEVTRRDHVATLTLHGEKSINIMGRALMEALLQAGEALQRDAELRLVVLTGAPGRGFIGGAHIAEMAELTPETARDYITRLHQVCRLFRALPVPSIARIEGYCLGGGMEVAAACDLRIGAAESQYGMPEVRVGIPSVIEARLLPTLIGWGRTRELLYTGRVIGAAEAGRIGFLERVAPAGGLDSALQPWVDDILRADPAAIRAQKRLIEDWLETPPAVGIQASVDAFAAAFRGEAPTRRLRAFLRRGPGE
jgi:enoyl-CoA hydratase/carnithine racemase